MNTGVPTCGVVTCRPSGLVSTGRDLRSDGVQFSESRRLSAEFFGSPLGDTTAASRAFTCRRSTRRQLRCVFDVVCGALGVDWIILNYAAFIHLFICWHIIIICSAKMNNSSVIIARAGRNKTNNTKKLAHGSIKENTYHVCYCSNETTVTVDSRPRLKVSPKNPIQSAH